MRKSENQYPNQGLLKLLREFAPIKEYPTILALSEKIANSNSTLSRILNNKIRLTEPLALKIQTALGIPYDRLEPFIMTVEEQTTLVGVKSNLDVEDIKLIINCVVKSGYLGITTEELHKLSEVRRVIGSISSELVSCTLAEFRKNRTE